MLSPRIETDRLILRRYKESDIDAIYEIITDERLSKYIKFPNLTKDEEVKKTCKGKIVPAALRQVLLGKVKYRVEEE